MSRKRLTRVRDRPFRRLSPKANKIICVVLTVFLAVGALGVLASVTLPDLFGSSSDGTQMPDRPSGITPGKPQDVIYSTDVPFGLGKYASDSGVLKYTYEGDYTESGYKLGFTPGGITTVGGNAENSSSWTSVVNIGGNDVLEVGQDAETSGNALNFTSLKTKGERYVFETDLRWLGSEGGVNPEHDDDDPNWFFRLEFFGEEQSNGNTFYWDMFCMYKLGEDYFYLSNDHEVYDYEIKIQLGTWVNLRVEYIPLSDTTANVLIYVNNKLVAQELDFKNKNDSGAVYSNSSFTKAQIENRGKCYDYVLQLDNTYVSAIGNGSSSGDNDADGSGSWMENVDPNGWTKSSTIIENMSDNTWL